MYWGSNEGTLRAFRNADRFTTFKNRSPAGRSFDDVPLQVNRGVPIGASAMLSSKIMKNATLKVYKGAPHGTATTLKHEVNAELLSFIQGKAQAMQPNR